MAQFNALHQKIGSLAFPCRQCQTEVALPLFSLTVEEGIIACTHCQQRYDFGDPNLLRQLRQFEALCQQIRLSEDILSSTSIGVDVGPHHVSIPFKLLLTRLNTQLTLLIEDWPLTICFRLEPNTFPSPERSL